MSEEQNIQWFPGHMAKTRRKIKESLNLVDAVAEIVDARIPQSSRNPEINELIAGKPRIILLNKCDMADSEATTKWINYYKSQNITALAVDCRTASGLKGFKGAVMNLLGDKLERYRQKGMVGKTLKIMVVGIPNVGKSSFINKMCGANRAKAENRPGVTRGNQWFKIDKDLELLDTPGILWPKFDDKAVGLKLAFTGAVKDAVLDTELLAIRLLETVSRDYFDLLNKRYSVEFIEDSYELLSAIAKRRGMMLKGGVTDTERAANMLLEEYRNCKIGRITLEKPEEI